MTLEEVKNLEEHYKKILDDSGKRIEQLKREIEESKAEITSAKAEGLEAAKIANEKAYTKARNKRDMHTERIRDHEAAIIDLEYGHLIDEDEFIKIDQELKRLQNQITNKTALQFMGCIGDLQRIASEYEKTMSICDHFGTFLQEKVFRKTAQYDPDRIETRGRYAYLPFSNFVHMLSAQNMPHSVMYGDISRRAGNALKAEAAAQIGLTDKAKEALESE